MVHACNPSAREVEASRGGLQEHPQLHGESDASQRFLSQSNTNKQKTNKQNLQNESKEESDIVIHMAAELSGAVSCEVSQIVQQEKGGRKKYLLERDGIHTPA